MVFISYNIVHVSLEYIYPSHYFPHEIFIQYGSNDNVFCLLYLRCTSIEYGAKKFGKENHFIFSLSKTYSKYKETFVKVNKSCLYFKRFFRK